MLKLRPIALTLSLAILAACHPDPFPAQVPATPPPPSASPTPADPTSPQARELTITVTLPAGVHERLRSQRRLGIQAAPFQTQTQFLVDSRASDAVKRLLEQGIVPESRLGDGGQRDNLTRAEMVTIVAKALGAETSLGTAVNGNLDASNWAAGYIALATDLAQQGYRGPASAPSDFNPDAPMTPAETLALINVYLRLPVPTTLPSVGQSIQALVEANRQGHLTLPQSLMASDLLTYLTPVLDTAAATQTQLAELHASFPDPMGFTLRYGPLDLAPFLDGIISQRNGDLTYTLTLATETLARLLDLVQNDPFNRGGLATIQIEDIINQSLLLSGTYDQIRPELHLDPRSTAETLLAQQLQQRRDELQRLREGRQPRQEAPPRPTTIDRDLMDSLRDPATARPSIPSPNRSPTVCAPPTACPWKTIRNSGASSTSSPTFNQAAGLWTIRPLTRPGGLPASAAVAVAAVAVAAAPASPSPPTSRSPTAAMVPVKPGNDQRFFGRKAPMIPNETRGDDATTLPLPDPWPIPCLEQLPGDRHTAGRWHHARQQPVPGPRKRSGPLPTRLRHPGLRRHLAQHRSLQAHLVPKRRTGHRQRLDQSPDRAGPSGDGDLYPRARRQRLHGRGDRRGCRQPAALRGRSHVDHLDPRPRRSAPERQPHPTVGRWGEPGFPGR